MIQQLTPSEVTTDNHLATAIQTVLWKHQNDDVEQLFKDVAMAEGAVETTFEVDLSVFYRFAYDIYEDLRDDWSKHSVHVQNVLKSWNGCAKRALNDVSEGDVPNMTFDLAEPGTDAEIELVPRNPPEDMVFRPSSDSPSDLIGQLVAFRGTCVVQSAVKPTVKEAAWECQRCGTVTYLPQISSADEGIQKPHECQGCERQGPFRLDKEQSDVEDTQAIKAQEDYSDVLTEAQPRNAEARITGSRLSNAAHAGDEVMVVGELESGLEGDTRHLTTWINALNIEQRSGDDIDYDSISTEEREQIRDIASMDDPVGYLTESIAPTIHGHEHAKRGILLQAAAPGSQTLTDGTRARGEIHILLIGDAGTGKTMLNYYAKLINKKSVSSSGTGSTKAGLTAAADDEVIGGSTKKVLKPGLLPLADGGLAVVDELDKVNDEITSLNNALEDGQIEFSKYGLNTTMKTRCNLLATANPKHGDFDPMMALEDQVEFDTSVMSRFDLRFAFHDEIDEDLDHRIAKAISKQHGGTLDLDGDEFLHPEFVAKYVTYAKQHTNPVYDPDGPEADAIHDTYTVLRQMLSDSSDGGLNKGLKPRSVGSMIRLAKASATLRLSDTVEMYDVEVAQGTVVKMLDSWGYDTTKFSGKSVSQYDVVGALNATYDELMHRNSGNTDGFALDEIVSAMQKDIPSSRVEEVLQQQSRSGNYYEQDSGKWLRA
ncbi:ATP-binding protein [Haloferax sulfurifontis]|uniref:DNA helicase n=1 Tax=Haloferax sulfurifontis ATCC BAA-897 TaxID=662480 RepID=M0I563_9EURY|nr:ATP-binding protein [Haloferax sulfurifontis]ELZ91158.1 MCM family protein [Haloferax sulfurifontis ATCC BAA-897]